MGIKIKEMEAWIGWDSNGERVPMRGPYTLVVSCDWQSCGMALEWKLDDLTVATLLMRGSYLGTAGWRMWANRVFCPVHAGVREQGRGIINREYDDGSA